MWPGCALLYSDTDSLIIEVETADVYADMRKRKEEFDFSDYPKDHPNYGELNKKVVGKKKDETSAIPIALVVFLKGKSYAAILTYPDKKGKQHKMAAKGNPKRLQDEATAMAFPGYLIEPGPQLEFNKIGSHNFQVFTWAQKELGYHNFFDKRFETGPFDTLYAHGHWRTREHHQ